MEVRWAEKRWVFGGAASGGREKKRGNIFDLQLSIEKIIPMTWHRAFEMMRFKQIYKK
ncbi:hypothetical protein QJS10_CPA03g00773 [Acorus calamus]|uniref:Uncharacterized protein n=1 Tax=Acorus calamus TaxID=4465 RepID=A0AAV9F598_ACOCL|nr:hypothetical protein QJS10_CPA03g00773 [Acorus calamus]